jgi:hypothetical protein
MAQTLSTFISSFADELAKPSRFDVSITLPSVLGSIVDSFTLSLRCENANLPGRTLETSDLRIYGPSEKMPNRSSYEDITMTFIVTNTMVEKKVFNSWMDYINPTNTWNFEYKSNYVSDIVITQYDLSNNDVHSVKLIEAYPIAITQMDLDWANQDYHKLSVTFTYRYWEVVGQNTADGQPNATTPTVGGPSTNQADSISVQDTFNDYLASYNNQTIGGLNLSGTGSVPTTFGTEIGGSNLIS